MRIESCHWCHNTIKEFDGTWFDNYGEQFCRFHPSCYDIKTLKTNGTLRSHETEFYVYEYVRKMFEMDNARGIDDNVVILSSRSRVTSRKAAERMLPRSGTMRREIYELVQRANGLTDYELEELLNGKHQTVSASRRGLVIDGFLVDSGRTRKNDVGNECIIWEITIKETLFG